MQSDGTVVSVGADTYKILKLDPMEAIDLTRDLAEIIGVPLAAAGGSMMSKSKDDLMKLLAEDSPESSSTEGLDLGRAATLFFQRVTREKQREIVTMMRRITLVVKDGKEIPLEGIFAIHFGGRTIELYKWLFAALKVQIGPFDVRAIVGAARQALKAQ